MMSRNLRDRFRLLSKQKEEKVIEDSPVDEFYIVEQALDDLTISLSCTKDLIDQWGKNWRARLAEPDFERVKTAVYSMLPQPEELTPSTAVDSSPPTTFYDFQLPKIFFPNEFEYSKSDSDLRAHSISTLIEESAVKTNTRNSDPHDFNYYVNPLDDPIQLE